jgi:hypothetical protein
MLFLGALDAFAGAIVIGYSNAVSVSSYPLSTMERVGRWRWFFAHASVGENIMTGLESLHAADPGFYPLTRRWENDEFPPATTQAGGFYEYWRGNPGWKAKVDDFNRYVGNGWHYPLADIIINKFCFVDPDADVNYYINSSSALERTNPSTRFVYVTIPLQTDEEYDNYRRNVFNDTLRTWVRANNRILLDLADIEAHDTNGLPQTFVYSDRVCQNLFDGYSADGGHLTTTTAQEMAAKGIYALGAALLDFIPDMNLQIRGLNGDLFQLEFYASADLTYTVQCCSDLALGSWQTLATLPPQSYERSVLISDSTAAGPQRFYRVLAQRP